MTIRNRDLGVAILALLVCSLGSLGCSEDRRSGFVVASTTAPSNSSAPAPLASPAPVTRPWSLPPGGPLTPAFRLEVARAFAPRLRFNAYHDDGNPSLQNRHEDFFPMGVASFLRGLEAGRVRVVVQGSSGPAPGVSEERSFQDVAVFGGDALGSYPRSMVGDPPGSAVVYVHVYEDPTGRLLAPDGSGELVVYVEYWLFYAHDRAEVPILGIPLLPWDDLFGHRADWEHTTYRIRVLLDPRATLAGGDVLEATYYSHDTGFLVSGSELERVDDAGQPDPAGRHPVVYVAQGKHASYPQAGEWKLPGYPIPGWISSYTDFFRGNGVVIDTWQGRLLDLEDPGAAPDEFSSPEFVTLVARSPGSPVGARLPDWTRYWGRWGPDHHAWWTPSGTAVFGSPLTPALQTSYGDFGGGHLRWSDAKLTEPDLRVYTDLRIVIPPTNPPPAPLRR